MCMKSCGKVKRRESDGVWGMASRKLVGKVTKEKAKELVYRFEVLLDNWQREINYCKKELKEIRKMLKNN